MHNKDYSWDNQDVVQKTCCTPRTQLAYWHSNCISRHPSLSKNHYHPECKLLKCVRKNIVDIDITKINGC